MAKLAIVCGAPSSEMDAPFDNFEYEIWVLGNRLDRYPRFDRIFEIHDDLSEQPEGYAQWLVNHDKPMVVGEQFPIPGLEVFPYQETVDLYGSLYMTSSSACMLAYALLKGYEHIELYGVDMAVDDHEYFWQRPCMEAWVGFAKGRGVNVVIPETSPFGKSDYVEGRDYGRERPKAPEANNEYAKLAESHQRSINAANDRLEALSAVALEIEQLKLNITAHDGARQAYERMAKVERAKQSKQDVKADNSVIIKG